MVPAYAVGLLITFVMLFVMEQGQPALVYLVPCILITGVVIGWRRGDLKKLWSGQMVLYPPHPPCLYMNLLLSLLVTSYFFLIVFGIFLNKEKFYT